MKLKMQSFMLYGAKTKSLGNDESIKDALVQEKINWFPIFKNKTCAGHIQIKTHFISEESSNQISSVYEGGLNKKRGLSVG